MLRHFLHVKIITWPPSKFIKIIKKNIKIEYIFFSCRSANYNIIRRALKLVCCVMSVHRMQNTTAITFSRVRLTENWSLYRIASRRRRRRWWWWWWWRICRPTTTTKKTTTRVGQRTLGKSIYLCRVVYRNDKRQRTVSPLQPRSKYWRLDWYTASDCIISLCNIFFISEKNANFR